MAIFKQAPGPSNPRNSFLVEGGMPRSNNNTYQDLPSGLSQLQQFMDDVPWPLSLGYWSPLLLTVFCKDLAGFAFKFGNSLSSVNGSVPISTHSETPYLPLSDPSMTSSHCDPLIHSVFLMSDHHPLTTI
ncbi:hypothetical protein DSO57_1006021 [Entomophthora muscae]|uniref:Uncharacterized protein n=1 Tax=Entomophthora muscae TaxID=34485 RepID=A0ACC2T7Q1_9FUNG|nr:hypothetical protein DSO57_1006021 [Entomophthora muscae]